MTSWSFTGLPSHLACLYEEV